MDLESPSIVDVDDLSTWPAAIARWVRGRAANVYEQVTTTQELGMRFVEQEDDFRRLFESRRLLAYHCTRLLDHEAADIRRHGMRALTADLVDDRIAQAVASGAVTEAQADRLRRNSVFALRESKWRAGKICFSLGRSVYDEDPDGVAWLLSLWGGEAIYWRMLTKLTRCGSGRRRSWWPP